MRDFIDDFGPPLFAVLFIVGIVGGIFGLITFVEIENQKWLCSSYPGDVKMVAGTCMVKSGDKYVTLDSYVQEKNHNVTVK